MLFWLQAFRSLQGYGATETCIVSANRPENNRVGSIGLLFTGIDVAIAEDGEIMLRGPERDGRLLWPPGGHGAGAQGRLVCHR